METSVLPILYSLHNCPYAIRARFALLKAEQAVRIRSIKLDNKPAAMIKASPKGSVPVLVIGSGEGAEVLQESLDIMLWALTRNDPNNLLLSDNSDALPRMLSVIQEFELNFIPAMEAFACAKRYHEANLGQLRQACEVELAKLESRLVAHEYLFSEAESLLDIAVVPFLRKYARIDKQWFRQSPYPKLRHWLNCYIQSPLFSKVMKNYAIWQVDSDDERFG